MWVGLVGVLNLDYIIQVVWVLNLNLDYIKLLDSNGVNSYLRIILCGHDGLVILYRLRVVEYVMEGGGRWEGKRVSGDI